MNIIVANKYKSIIHGSGIDVLKELDGIFKVSDISNSINSIFYKKLIIYATALDRFPKEDVLNELVKRFDVERLILFLPPDNPPPKRFLSFLVSINLYNFTDNINGLLGLMQKSNTYEDVSKYVVSEPVNQVQNSSDFGFEQNIAETQNGRIILGFKNATKNAGSTSLVYMLMKALEEVHKVKAIAVEVEKRDFVFYANQNMYSIQQDKVNEFLSISSQSEIVLVDLGDDGNPELCSDIIYLVEPSLYRINELIMTNRNAFNKLKGKKVVLNKSLLTDRDIEIFSKEANISIYFNLPPLNDRIHNKEIDNLLLKLGLIEEFDDKPKKGLLDLFK